MEPGYMKSRSVLDILACQQTSGPRRGQCNEAAAEGVLTPRAQSPPGMHGASRHPQFCCIAARWAHSAIASTYKQGPERHRRGAFLKASDKAGGLGGPQGRQPCPCSTKYHKI